MKPSFTSLEVLNFAISLEEEGIIFYEKFAKKAKGETRELFLKLADDERSHAGYFTKLYKEAQESQEAYDYLFDAGINDFFHSYAKSEAFSSDPKKVETVEEAIQEGIDTEAITIDFYKQLMPYVNDKTQETLRMLIDEEEDHLERLKKIKELY